MATIEPIIVWHHGHSNETQIWRMDGHRITGRLTVVDERGQKILVGLPWEIVGVGDVTGDGKADIVWHHRQSSETQIWRMDGHRITGRLTVVDERGQEILVGLPWEIVGVGDVTGDGKADIVWHHGHSNETQIWRMDGHRITGRLTVVDERGQKILVGLPWEIVGVGDVTGDGKADIVWHHGQSNETQIWRMDGHRITGRLTVVDERGQKILVGLPWEIVQVGDLTGDGKADIVWHHGQSNETQIWRMDGHRITGRLTVVDERGQKILVGLPWSIAGSGAATSAANTGRMCDYLDAPGTPQIGINSYLLKRRPPRGPRMNWSVSGLVNGVSITEDSMFLSMQRAFALWENAVPALHFINVQSGGDITIGVGDLGAPNSAGNVTLGSTAADGSTVTLNNNPAVTFVPALPGGNSLLGVAAHEIGHAIGILHSTTLGTLMFPSGSMTEKLADDDIAAVRALYGWTPQRLVPDIGTDASPALCVCGPWLVMAWRGIGNDNRIWFSRTRDGVNWLPQQVIAGTGSTDGPTMAWDGAKLWLAIRGVPDDNALYWATSTDVGDHWSAVTPIPGTGSACAPSLTIARGAPLLVWRGISGDDALYYTTWQNPWAAQQQIGGTGSDDRPSVCVGLDNLPRMAWRGIPGDDSLYTTTLVGQFWQPQQQLSWVIAGNGPQGTVGIGVPGSTVGPMITNAGDRLFLAWQGVPGDDAIYFTQAAEGPGGQPLIEWSSQAIVAGIGTSHRPAIVMFMGLPFMAWKGVHDDHAVYTISQVRSSS